LARGLDEQRVEVGAFDDAEHGLVAAIAVVA
jgi:hypothetical protein